MNGRMHVASNRSRAVGFTAGAALVALLLSGCFTVTMDLRLQADDTVDGSVIVAVDKAWAKRSGGVAAFVQTLVGGDATILLGQQPSAGSVEAKEYVGQDRVGAEYVLAGVPISDFGRGSDGDLSIRRVADSFVVSGKVDLSPALDGSSPKSQALLDSGELTLSVTFPGEVIETNGEVSGTTVTWTPRPSVVTDIRATGKAGQAQPTALLIAGGVLMVVIVSALVLFALTRRGRFARCDSPSSGTG